MLLLNQKLKLGINDFKNELMIPKFQKASSKFLNFHFFI